MRRFITLLVLLLCAVPFGVSVSGCSKKSAPTFCNGGDSGVIVGQPTTITLQPLVTGYSLNYAQIGQLSQPTSTDCKGNTASVGSYTYGTSDLTIADVEPTTGKLCGGTWNRHRSGPVRAVSDLGEAARRSDANPPRHADILGRDGREVGSVDAAGRSRTRIPSAGGRSDG